MQRKTDLLKKRSIKLQRSLALLKATLESTADGILAISKNGKIINFNKKFIEMWQIPKSSLKGRPYEVIRRFISRKLLIPSPLFNPKNPTKSHSMPETITELKLKNGTIFECYTIPQHIGKKNIGIVISFRDVTQRRFLEQELQHLATHDLLTGLPNRTLLMDRINQSILHAKRTNSLGSLLFLDLDNFKDINDHLSHSIGDALLQAIAVRLQNFLRKNDTIARFGGDEFVIVLTGLNSKDDVITVAKKLLEKIIEPFKIKNHKIKITCSIGYAIFPTQDQDAETLLKNADIAMYQAKSKGGNSLHDF